MTKRNDIQMHSSIVLEVDNKPANFSSVWVHLRSKSKIKSVQFRVSIPDSHVREIFDPYNTKPESDTWSEFIRNQIESLGTFIMEAYFDAMARKTGNEEKRFEWVIVMVNTIAENAEGVKLIGQAERFEPAAY